MHRQGEAKQTTIHDKHVGGRIRSTRLLRGWSQTKLGNQLGVTFQQIQKYEKGFNRVGAGRLWEISILMDVPITHFFQDIPGAGRRLNAKDPSIDTLADDKMALKAATLFQRIEDARTRQYLMALIRNALRMTGADDD